MIQIMSRIFDYTGCTNPTMALLVFHNFQGKLSQSQVFVLSLNVDTEGEMQSTSKYLISEP